MYINKGGEADNTMKNEMRPACHLLSLGFCVCQTVGIARLELTDTSRRALQKLLQVSAGASKTRAHPEIKVSVQKNPGAYRLDPEEV